MKNEENERYQQLIKYSPSTQSTYTNLYQKLGESLRSSIFPLVYYIFQSKSNDLSFNIICIFIEFFEIMTFAFETRYKEIWKTEKFFRTFSYSITYLRLAEFLQGNKEIYLCVFYMLVMAFMIYLILFFYTANLFKNNKFNKKWILNILNIPFSLLSNAIFLPYIQMLMSIFYCDKETKTLIYITEIKCWKYEHLIHCFFGLVCLICLISFQLLNIYTFSDIAKDAQSCSSKKSNESDFSLLLLKIYFPIVNAFFDLNKFNFTMLFISFVLTLYVLYTFYFYRPFYNITIMTMYLCSVTILAWVYGVLVFLYFLKNTKFDGGFELFFIGVFFIIFFLMMNSVQMVNFGLVISLPLAIKTETLFLDKVEMLEMLFDTNEESRKSSILLKGYIQSHEETCAIKNCPLKEFLKNENQIYLLRHIEEIYQLGISKFSGSAKMRLGYVQFLLNKLHKVQQAQKELMEIQDRCDPNYNEQFCIFQLTRKIEQTSLDTGKSKGDNSSTFAEIKYISMKKNFKKDLDEAVKNYLEFWNSLMVSSQNIVQDIGKLADVGGRISKLNEEITNLYTEIVKINPKEIELNQLYTSYQINILNNIDYINENDDNFDEVEALNDLENPYAELSKENKILVVSAQPDNFGIITRVSLGSLSFLGFMKEELVSQHINILIPEIFHTCHNEVLYKKTQEINKNQIYGGSHEKELIKELNYFGINKARYLIPLNAKIYTLIGESGELNYICYINTSIYNINSNVDNVNNCFVLTNNEFIIQNFSANSINLLGLQSNMLNGTYDILKNLKQFQEEYLKKYFEYEKEKIPFNRRDMKRAILNKKFLSNVEITWKLKKVVMGNDESSILRSKFQNNMNKGKDNVVSNISYNDNEASNVTGQPKEGKNFIMNVKKIKFNKVTKGYIFNFTVKEKDHIISSFLVNNSTSNMLSNISKINPQNITKSKIDEPTPTPDGNNNQSKFNNQNNNNNNNNIDNQANVSSSEVNKFIKKDDNNVGSNIVSKDNVNDFGGHRVPGDFIPKFNKGFVLDAQKMRFIQKDEINEQFREKMKGKIKNLALEKLQNENMLKKKDTKSNTDDSNKNSDEEEESGEGSLDENSEEKEESSEKSKSYDSELQDEVKEMNVKPEIKNIEKFVPTVKIQDEYYKVNMSKITYYVYNYATRTTTQQKDYVNTSKVDEIIKDEINQTNKIDSDNNNKKKEKLKKESNMTPEEIENSKKKTDAPISNKSHEVTTFIKSIQFALQRKDEQKTVFFIKMVCFGIIIVILGEIIFYTYYLKQRLNNIDIYLELLSAGNKFFKYNAIAILEVRELTLLNNFNYSVVGSADERVEYTNEHIAAVKELYGQLFDELSTITSQSMMVSKNVFGVLNNKTNDLQMLNADLTIQQVQMSRSTAFTLMVASLFKISRKEIADIRPLDDDVFIFMLNSLNANYQNCEEQKDLFFEQIKKAFEKQIIHLIIICVCFCIVNILLFFVFKWFYEQVTIKKESYIQVFYSINGKILLETSSRCEKFLLKLNRITNKTSELSIDEESQSGMANFEEFDDLIQKKDDNKGGRGHNKDQKRANPYIYLVWIFILAIGCGSLLFCTVYQSLQCDNGKKRQTQVSSEVTLQIESIMAFNLMREYFFNPNVTYNFAPLYEVVGTLIDKVYGITETSLNEIKNNIDFSNSDRKLYNKIMTQNLCEYAKLNGTEEENEFECNDESDETIKEGLTIVLMHYMEELRNIYTQYLILEKTQNYNKDKYNMRYNMTLRLQPAYEDDARTILRKHENGTIIYRDEELWPNIIQKNKSVAYLQQRYNDSHPLKIFNKVENRKIIFLLKSIIIPAFDELYELLISKAVFDSKGIFEIETIVNIVLGVIIVILFVFGWKRHEMSLSETINKAKKMLSIIPIETLMKVKNIAKLLNIEASESDHKTSALWVQNM